MLGLLFLFSTSFLFSNTSEMLESIEKTIPSVVFVANQYNSFDDYFDPDPDSYIEYLRPIYEFFWPRRHSHGSGFIISPEGYVVTNAHVVDDVTYTCVALATGDVRVLKAHLVGSDPRTDIAVLKIDSDEEMTFPYLVFGDSDQAKIGQEVAIVGNPLNTVLESTVTTGIISGRERHGFDFREVEEFIQTDASINPGNSGGPMINEQGEVIGVISAGYFWFEGLNFVVPSQIAQKIVEQLIENGEVSRGYLGVVLEDDSEAIFDRYAFDRNQGAILSEVIEDSPAEEAGLMEGDCIVSINGHRVKSAGILMNQLAIVPPYEEVELKVIREGETFFVSVTLGEKK